MLEISKELKKRFNKIHSLKKRGYAPKKEFTQLILSTNLNKDKIGYQKIMEILSDLGLTKGNKVKSNFGSILNTLSEDKLILLLDSNYNIVEDSKDFQNNKIIINPDLILKKIMQILQNPSKNYKYILDSKNDKTFEIINRWIVEPETYDVLNPEKVFNYLFDKNFINSDVKEYIQNYLNKISTTTEDYNKSAKLTNWNIICEKNNSKQKNIFFNNELKEIFENRLKEYLELHKIDASLLEFNKIISNSIQSNHILKKLFNKINKKYSNFYQLDSKKATKIIINLLIVELNLKLNKDKRILPAIKSNIKVHNFTPEKAETNRIEYSNLVKTEFNILIINYEASFIEFQNLILKNKNYEKLIIDIYGLYSKYILFNNINRIIDDTYSIEFNYESTFEKFILSLGQLYYNKDIEPTFKKNYFNNINPIYLKDASEPIQEDFNFIIEIILNASSNYNLKDEVKLFLELCKDYYYLSSIDTLKVNLPYF